MNREIKFRAWNRDDDKMEYPLVISCDTDGIMQPLIKCSDGNRAYKDYPLMQYTGLKDRNGKEIYEHDLVTQGGQTLFVSFSNGAFRFVNELQRWEQNIDTTVMQVIGNIYENPELP